METCSPVKKGCEALIIHFCFPCPISGIRSFLCSSSDRSIGRSRGFQWGWNWNGASEGKEGRSVWEIEDFESSWRDGKIPVAGGRLPLGWKILTYIELKWHKQLCMFQIFSKTIIISYRISHNIEGKGSVKRPPARPRPDAHRGGIHEAFPQYSDKNGTCIYPIWPSAPPPQSLSPFE